MREMLDLARDPRRVLVTPREFAPDPNVLPGNIAIGETVVVAVLVDLGWNLQAIAIAGNRRIDSNASGEFPGTLRECSIVQVLRRQDAAAFQTAVVKVITQCSQSIWPKVRIGAQVPGRIESRARITPFRGTDAPIVQQGVEALCE